MAFLKKDRAMLERIVAELESLDASLVSHRIELDVIQRREELRVPAHGDPTGNVHDQQAFAVELASREVRGASKRLGDALEHLYEALR